MAARPEVLLIDPCNFQDYPTGGQLSFAKQMMKAFGNRLALVGISTDKTPVGRWVQRRFDGIDFMYFGFCRCRPTCTRPLIPGRIQAFAGLLRYRRRIFESGIPNVFTQSPEAMIAIGSLPWTSVCYCFAGAESPLRRPRYRWARWISPIFEAIWWRALAHADVLLAAADNASIEAFLQARGIGQRLSKVLPFPTRYDEGIFHPLDRAAARSAVGIPQDCTAVTSVGRINVVKGWRLVLDAFDLFAARHRGSRIYFVGDGEDRPHLISYARQIGRADAVEVTGLVDPHGVATYLNASDLVVFGSHHEGWSVAMLEALACGKPIVSTDVSGAREMIRNGVNGFIVDKRDPVIFAQAMHNALSLGPYARESEAVARQYRLAGLAQDLGRLWPPLAPGGSEHGRCLVSQPA